MNVLRRLHAQFRFGTPLAADPTYRALLLQEWANQRAHKAVNPIRKAKSERLHQALRGAK